jgi:hypothetical protein
MLEGGQAGFSPATMHDMASRGIQGGGAPLPHREAIQASFGRHDVSAVQAHLGSEAAQANRELGSKGFALGNNAAFAGAPSLFTAAHEAAHVVQQRSGVALQGGIGERGDRYEQHANAVAAEVVAGRSAEATLDRLAPGAGNSGGGAAVQLDELPNAGPSLDSAGVRSALAFNNSKGFAPDMLAKIAKVVGASQAKLDEALVLKVATWQKTKGLTGDGKIGNIGLQWMSQEPGGAGLETLVTSNATVYLGVNPTPRAHESAALREALGQSLTAATGSAQQDTVKIGTATHDLTTSEGVDAFVKEFSGLDSSRQVLLKQFIENSSQNSADEIAQLCLAFYKAETGKTLVKRMILSGHSGGWSIVGDAPNDTSISFSHLVRLNAIFPKAVGQVEDLMISGCNSGQEGKLAQYRAIFPNLKSIWGYVGYSPTAPLSTDHIKAWDQGTRGSLDAGKVHGKRKEVAQKGRKNDKHAAVWTNDGKTKTYETASEEAQLSYDTMRGLVDSGMSAYTDAFDSGRIDRTVLSTLYTNLQVLVGNFGYRLGGEQAKFEKILKRTLYLRFWDKITQKFMGEKGAGVKAGYQKAGASAPAYAGQARNKVLGWIAAYPASGGDEGRKLLENYLRDLEPSLIPDTWF